MKRSGFSKPSYEEAIAKKKAKQATRTLLKRSKLTSKRAKVPKVTTLRNKADKMLTPIIKAMYPECLLKQSQNCAFETQVAHHHIKKSQSTSVRYDLDNLIPLCHACHLMLHSQETTWASYIVGLKGLEWWNNLYTKSRASIKADRFWYQEQIDRLDAVYQKLL